MSDKKNKTLHTIKNLIFSNDIKVNKVTLGMLKTSILCAPRGFIIFLLGTVSAIDSVILGNERRKKEALYAMYHNSVPFLEVSVLMTTIMIVFHTRTNINKAIIPFICLASAFGICMLLRIFDIRKDCCDDINYKRNVIFDECGKFLNFSFKIPSKDSDLSAIIPRYFFKESENDSNKTKRSGFHSFIYKLLCSPLLLTLLVIQSLDLVIRCAINFINSIFTCKFIADDIKKSASLEIPFTLFTIMSFLVPFYSNCFGRIVNKFEKEKMEVEKVKSTHCCVMIP